MSSALFALYKSSISRRTITVIRTPIGTKWGRNGQLPKYSKTVRYYGRKHHTDDDEDDMCAQYRDPPPKRSGRGILLFVGVLFLAGSAVIGYAKYDPEFRKTLVERLPFTNDVIKHVFQEEKTYSEQFSSLYNKIKNKLCPSPPSKK